MRSSRWRTPFSGSDRGTSAITALKSATVSVATEANDHGMDCGPQGLSQNLYSVPGDEVP